MAKVSMIERGKKRRRLESKYREKHDQLKELARVAYTKGEIPWEVQGKLQKIPRNASLTRLENRCQVCGRIHSVYRRFGLCRLCLRKYAMLGYVPGLKKSSW